MVELIPGKGEESGGWWRKFNVKGGIVGELFGVFDRVVYSFFKYV